jgi:hypothetical protein
MKAIRVCKANLLRANRFDPEVSRLPPPIGRNDLSIYPLNNNGAGRCVYQGLSLGQG